VFPEKTKYPDYYAGSYINSDNELVVLVTETSSDKYDSLKKAAKSEKLMIKDAKFSYKQLNKIMDDINKYMVAHQKSTDELFSAFGIATLYDDKNCIIVKMKDLNDERLERWKNWTF